MLLNQIKHSCSFFKHYLIRKRKRTRLGTVALKSALRTWNNPPLKRKVEIYDSTVLKKEQGGRYFYQGHYLVYTCANISHGPECCKSCTCMSVPLKPTLPYSNECKAFWFLVFTAFAPKCKVIRKRASKSRAWHIPFSVPTHTQTLTKGQPRHRELHALIFSNSVWVP